MAASKLMSPISARTRAGQAGQRPGEGEHHRGDHQHEQDAAHQPCVAQAASAALASSRARAWASQSAIGLGGGAGQAGDRGHGASQVAGVERSARAGQHAGGGVADDDAVALADGDEVLGAQPDAVEQRLSVGGGPGGRQGRGARLAGRRGELCLGGGLRGGEAGERRRRAWQVAERLAGVERDPGGLDLGGAAGGFLQGGEAGLRRHRAGGRGRPCAV